MFYLDAYDINHFNHIKKVLKKDQVKLYCSITFWFSVVLFSLIYRLYCSNSISTSYLNTLTLAAHTRLNNKYQIPYRRKTKHMRAWDLCTSLLVPVNWTCLLLQYVVNIILKDKKTDLESKLCVTKGHTKFGNVWSFQLIYLLKYLENKK